MTRPGECEITGDVQSTAKRLFDGSSLLKTTHGHQISREIKTKVFALACPALQDLSYTQAGVLTADSSGNVMGKG